MWEHKSRRDKPKANSKLLCIGWYVPKLVALMYIDEPLSAIPLPRS